MSEALRAKLADLAAAMPRLVNSVTDRTDQLVKRIEATEARSVKVFAAKHSDLDNLEAGVDMVDRALDVISNGGPPLEGSPKPSDGSGG